MSALDTYYNGHLNEARIRGTYRANERLSFSLAEQWNRFRLGIVSDSAGNLLPVKTGEVVEINKSPVLTRVLH